MENGYIKHQYGPQVKILDNVFLSSLLAKLGHPNTVQPTVNYIITKIYENLFSKAISEQFPKKHLTIETRMKEFNKEGEVSGDFIDFDCPAICASLARAGILPSAVGYDMLNSILNPSLVRQDHIYASRTVNESNQVTGTSFQGSKIGGPVENAVVFIPDPMGATGSTLVQVLDFYKENIEGKALKFIAVHLIITPEYIKKVLTAHPDLIIYSIRLDRGLSDSKALQAEPGEFPELEKGLNDMQYIVPGAGGLGEIMNNSYV